MQTKPTKLHRYHETLYLEMGKKVPDQETTLNIKTSSIGSMNKTSIQKLNKKHSQM